ncbi:MAG: hypothetical protein IJQ85_03705 [Selenomonadaceae bacterium]|nr:hypothetical protein [Selenomonadaceae bacterium]
MKKFFTALSLLALINFGTCSAENVHAVGRGNTERMAIRDAMRAAIEQKFGAVVNSKTRVKDYMLISDENSVDSAGLISSWEIISSRVVNGIFVVEISAEVDDKKIPSRLIDKKALVDFNADNPRVAVVAIDSRGRHYPEIENEIISALKMQGFTRTIDLAQVSRAVQLRMISADDELCKTLANDFHVDCLVVAEVKILSGNEASISSRVIKLNTGEIIFAGTSTGGGEFLSGNDALKMAGRRAGNEISLAAFKSAANVERHLTLLITKNTFERLGGTLTAVQERIKNISGVNDAFTRKLNTSLELDVDFDGTASDFAQLLERLAIKILEVSAGYVKI